MFYDLNVPWTNQPELQRTLAFLAELDYNVVALNYTIAGKLPADLTSPIPSPLPFSSPPRLQILRRVTLLLTDPSQNHRLSTLTAVYDLLALRPTTERALQQACQSLDCDVISLDLSVRHPFHFKHKTLSQALQRGVKIEICYGAGMNIGDGATARRNLIANATEIIRATRGKGIVISSEAKRALACRGPWDVINLAAVWGLGQENGREAVGREARAVVVQAEMKRRSFKGVVDIIYGGEKPERAKEDVKKVEKGPNAGKNKRKLDAIEDKQDEVAAEIKPIYTREQKRRAQKARTEAAAGTSGSPAQDANLILNKELLGQNADSATAEHGG
ncbi:hypothetical protein MMC14_007861 [Varicellaria rhodocarpa]|nr:hypothetical protein [Varicellaria rhodocarpa]